MLMQDFGVTAVCCTPSYFLYLVERLRRPRLTCPGCAWVSSAPNRGARACANASRPRPESAPTTSTASPRSLAPGSPVECVEQRGLHVFEDHFYPEIVDPDSGEVLPEGVEGELVLTTLSKQAMPMIRYRTRDITALVSEQCACGRTLRRIRRIGRRSDDMMIIRGVNVFPSQIEIALLRVEGTLPHYQIVLTRAKGLDQMEVKVEVTAEVFSDEIKALENLRHRLEATIENIVGLRVAVTLVEPRTIPRSQGKACRVTDLRDS